MVLVAVGVVPASDSTMTFRPPGPSSRMSMSRPHWWLNERNVTVTLLTTPVRPVTLIEDGYGEPAVLSRIVIAVAFVNACVCVWIANTVTTNASLVVLVPSLTKTVMVAVPDWSVSGVTVTVRFDPLPPNTILFVGTKVGLEDALLNVRLPTGVSTSLRVKASAAVDVFVKID